MTLRFATVEMRQFLALHRSQRMMKVLASLESHPNTLPFDSLSDCYLLFGDTGEDVTLLYAGTSYRLDFRFGEHTRAVLDNRQGGQQHVHKHFRRHHILPRSTHMAEADMKDENFVYGSLEFVETAIILEGALVEGSRLHSHEELAKQLNYFVGNEKQND
jgi:hypothetical protein